MSDQSMSFETTDTTNDETGPSIQELRDAAKRGAEARAEADAAKRELAFYRAGVDLDSPIGKLFAKAYEGELDAEQIKAAYAEVATAVPQPGTSEQINEAETRPDPAVKEQTDLRQELASGGGEATSQDSPDPSRAGYDAYMQRVREGASREEASAELFSRIIDAAAKGDERVIWKAES